MALEIGAAYISIIPSTKGMIRDIKRSLNKDGGKAATEAGRDMGRNMSKAIADELSEVDPFDHMRTSVSKSRSEVNEFSKAMSKASKEVVDANNKARVAQARYGEALSRSNTKASTLLNLQLAAKKATDDLTNSQARLAAAEQSRGAQISDLVKRERELAHATSLRSQAEKLAAMTRQTMVDRLRSQFAGRGSGLNLQVELDPGAPVKLGAELERVRNELRNRYKIELDLDVDRNAISHVGNAVRRAFNSERMTSFRSGLAGVSEGFAQMRTKIMHLVPGTWVILGTLGAIAAMTFAPLIASMTQVIGLLAAIPALATAAAGAIAAIAVGSQGVFKAIGAGLKPPKNAGAGGSGNARQLEQAQKRASRAAADGAKQIAAAEKQLARAQRDAQKAQEDLSEARREAADDIADLNQRLQESQLDEEGAVLGVRRAYESLRETLGDADSSALDKDEARHRYKESIANLERVRRENAELAEETARANAAGVEGHEKVVDAQERVATAAEAVTDAQAGVADAAESAAQANADAADAMAAAAAGGTAGAAAVDEYAEALAGLTPSAREFVETVLSLRDAWGTVKDATQEALFKGMGPAFQRFSTTYIPVLRDGLSGIAAEFNAGFGRMFEDLQRPDVVASWNGIFGNLATATAPFMDALRSIAELFTDIALIGTGYFDDIAVHIRDWADGLRDAVNANPERIHGWIQNAIEAFGRMKTTAGLVLELIYKIFSPGTETGDKMWDKINQTLERWNDSLGKPENQDRLRKLFQDALQMAKDMKEILEGTAKIVGFLADLTPDRSGETTSESDRGGGSGGYEKPAPKFGTIDWMLGRGADDPDVNLWSMFKGMFTPQDGWNAYRESKGLGGGGAGGEFGKGGGTNYAGMSDDELTGAMRNAPQEGGGFAFPDVEGWSDSFSRAGASISETWNAIINPVKDAWNTGWSMAGTKFGEFKTGVSTKWTELSTGVSGIYNTGIKPILDRFGFDTGSLRNIIGIATGVMRGDWGMVSSNLTQLIDNHMGPALDRLGGFANRVKDTFGNVVNGINTKWAELKSGTASVINWIIRNVFNNGLKNAWNTAAKFLPITAIGNIPEIPGYRVGGAIHGPGSGTSDSIIARLSNGEHVLTAQEVRAMGGHRQVYAMRERIRRGVWPMGHGAENMPRFKDGGEIDGGGRLSPTPGEGGLQDIAKLAKRLIHRIWPSITTIGGYRQDAYPEHPSGRALDVMVGVGNPIGDEVTSWALANDAVLPLQHALWKQTVWMPGGATQPMGDRGSPTQNHMDHPHLWYKPKAIDPNVVPDGLVGYDGLTDGDRISRIKAKISEILAKIMDPIGESIKGGFAPPPHLDEMPGGFYDKTRVAIEDKTMGIVDDLGDKLKEVYKAAREVKDIIGNVVGAGIDRLPFIKRDTGGILPQGTSMVLNETGKPEQILNWDQITQIQGVMRDAMRLVRDLGKQFDREADAELIANAIGERLDKTDWEAVALRLSAFTEQADKVLRAAGDSFADDALGVFGVRNGRKRFEEYAAIGKALSGESDADVSADMSGVPSPESVISGATSARALPSVSQKKMSLDTEMPDIAEGGGGPVKDQVRQAFAKYGWDKEPYWGAVDWIVGKESTWNPTARNPSSGAFGLFQFLGGTKQAYLPDENPNPAVQGAAGAKYIKDRYGDPLKARAFWECLPLDTLILTKRGWIAHDEVEVGDYTVGFNPESGRSEWTRITQVHHYDDAPLIEMGGTKFKVRSTPNHRWVAEKSVQRTRGGSADAVEMFVSTEEIGSRHRVRLAANADLSDGLPISDLEAELLGWVMGDGSYSGGSMRVYQNKPKYLSDLDELFSHFPHGKYSYEREGYGVENIWELRRPFVRDLVARSGYGDDFVGLVLSMSESQREAFLRGVIAAEGYISTGFDGQVEVQRIAQAVGPKRDAIILAVYLSGYRPAVTTTIKEGEHRDVSDIRLTRPWSGGEVLARTRREVESAAVWCVTTELGSWTAQQDDQVFLTGNSNGWYDKGGVLKPGRTLAQNDSGKDELILNNRAWHDMSTTVTQAARMAELVSVGAPGGSRDGDTINLYTNDTDNAIRAFRRREAQKAQSRIGLR